MSAAGLGRRYARALLEISDSEKNTDKVARQLSSLAETWESSPELRSVFENPSFGAEARREVLKGLGTRLALGPTVTNTLKLLSDRRRMRHLPEVIEAFITLAEANAGRVRAEVTTAQPMPESYFGQLQQALEKVTGQKVVLVKKQDPTLIGGVVTKVGDKVFDGSIRTRLSELRDELLSPAS
ncbi:MAG: ATP synthase F1 subunit delta [Myxococcota bacterium]